MDGSLCISNKPVYFTRALADKKKKGWMPIKETVDAALTSLKKRLKAANTMQL